MSVDTADANCKKCKRSATHWDEWIATDLQLMEAALARGEDPYMTIWEMATVARPSLKKAKTETAATGVGSPRANAQPIPAAAQPVPIPSIGAAEEEITTSTETDEDSSVSVGDWLAVENAPALPPKDSPSGEL